MRKLIAAGMVLLAAGCGGASHGATRGGVKIDYESGQSIISALNAGGFPCTSPERNTEAKLSREDWTCKHGSEDVSVTTFVNHDQLVTVFKAFGSLMSGYAVKGDAWAVGVATRPEALQVQRLIGGKVS